MANFSVFKKDILKIQLSVQNLNRFSINGLLHFESDQTADQTMASVW